MSEIQADNQSPAEGVLVVIDAAVTPAILKLDFEAIRVGLQVKLDKYDVVVTSDTLKDAKELGTKLNKTAGFIDDKRKELVAEASTDIKDFDAEMRGLTSMCKVGRTKLLDQIKVFEDETRDKVRVLLKSMLGVAYDQAQMAVEFMTVDIEDLVILSNLTAKGHLTAKAKQAISDRVAACKERERLVEKRLLELEALCYKKGLKSPLTRTHIDHFLMDDQSAYDTRLLTLIDVELDRQSKAEAQAVETEGNVQESKQRVKKVAQPKKDGRQNWEVVVKFDIETADTAGKEAIRSKLMARLLEAGFKEEIISSVSIEEA